MTTLQEVKRGFNHMWESFADGWHDLRERASNAVTRFTPGKATPPARSDEDDPASDLDFPRLDGWAFMAADVYDDDDRLVVRLEAPGMKRDDFTITIDGDMLVVQGEKRFGREGRGGSYRLLQCAYGSFRRAVSLPVKVQVDKARASYRDGVLKVELPKAEGAKRRRIPIAVQ